MKEQINVMVSCDAKGLYLQKLSLLNLMESSQDDDIHIYFLNMSLTDEKIRELADLIDSNSNFDFTEVKVDPVYKRYINKQMILWNCDSYASCVPECYIRLCIPFIFPEMKKCVWLDNDVFVLKSLSLMYDTVIFNESEYFGAYRDKPKKEGNLVLRHILCAYGVKAKDYTCNGIIVFNMDVYRERLSTELFEKINEKMGRHFMLKEQDLLNVLSVGHKNFLDESAYLQYYQDEGSVDPKQSIDLDNTALIHSCGAIKPCHAAYYAKEIKERVYIRYINFIGEYEASKGSVG